MASAGLKQQRGFTLIELLVVISIVSLLSSVVLASLNNAREKGRLAAAKQFSANAFHAAGDQSLALFDLQEGPTSTTALDRSGNGNNASLQGGATWSADTPGFGTYSLSLDGVNDYALGTSLLGISGDAEFTMCAWIKWSGSWSSDYPSFMGNNSTGVTNQGLSFTVKDGRPAVDFWSNRFRASATITSDAWHYLCGTKTPGAISATTKLYVDGLQASGAVEGSNVSPNIVDAVPILGRLDGSRWFRGLVDNAYFFGKTLTAEEIGRLYAAGLNDHSLARSPR